MTHQVARAALFLTLASSCQVAPRPRPPALADAASGRDAGTASASIHHLCPMHMIAIPSGTLSWRSVDDGSELFGPVPTGTVSIAAFCIDETEVTVQSFAHCVAARACPAPSRSIMIDEPGVAGRPVECESRYCNFYWPNRREHPMNCLNVRQAEAYCRWRHGTLPSEAEWVFAAGGGDGRDYPWGRSPPAAGQANAFDESALRAGVGDAPSVQEEESGRMYGFAWNDQWPATAPAGTFTGDRSVFGVLDMGGNVEEFVTFGNGRSRLAAVLTKGGSFGCPQPSCLNIWERGVQEEVPLIRSGAIGFRCVTDQGIPSSSDAGAGG